MIERHAIKVTSDLLAGGFAELPVMVDDNLEQEVPPEGGVRLAFAFGEEVQHSRGANVALYLQLGSVTAQVFRPKGEGQGHVWQDAADLKAILRGQQVLAPPGGTGHLLFIRTESDRVGPDPERDLYQVNVTGIFENHSYFATDGEAPLMPGLGYLAIDQAGFAVKDWVAWDDTAKLWVKALAAPGEPRCEGVVIQASASRAILVTGGATRISGHGWSDGPLYLSQVTRGAGVSIAPSIGISRLLATVLGPDDMIVVPAPEVDLG